MTLTPKSVVEFTFYSQLFNFTNLLTSLNKVRGKESKEDFLIFRIFFHFFVEVSVAILIHSNVKKIQMLDSIAPEEKLGIVHKGISHILQIMCNRSLRN